MERQPDNVAICGNPANAPERESGTRQGRGFGWLWVPLVLTLLAAGCGLDDSGKSGDGDEARVGRIPVPPETEQARVDRVVDGDTVYLEGLEESVRLIGVDAPEATTEVECHGREAAEFVERVAGPGTEVRYVLGEEPRDQYGRFLAHLWLADGRMLGQVLVGEGFAELLTIEPNTRYAERFEAAEERARQMGRGLWGMCA